MELQLKDSLIVHQGSVEFKGFETLKSQAEQVAEIIRNTEVNEENLKQSKKMLAAANNSIAELDRRRIDLKKHLLEPYQKFEEQVNEIKGIVKTAEQEQRQKVNELEERERDDKEKELRGKWELRFRPYAEELTFITFEDFLSPRHLNKTQSVKNTEKEMGEWLVTRSRDVKSIMNMEHSLEILSEYKKCLDLGLSVYGVEQRYQEQADLKKMLEKNKEVTHVTIFKIKDEKDAKMVELLLKEHGIEFTMDRM